MHSLHVDAPKLSWYVPGAHGLQASCIRWSLYEPAAHAVASLLPTGQKVPSPHTSQSAALVIVTPSRMVVPPGQGSGAAEPAAQ